MSSSSTPSEPLAPSAGLPQSSRGRWWGVISLLLITLLGGFLRFWRLDHQAYWTDESATLGRIRGSLEHMARALSDQGFPPGWYVLLRSYALMMEHWLKNPAEAWTPEVMRALPAALSTLMVPAAYFLARQFMDRRGATLVAILTAVNPYLIYYSRDLKMYGPCWMLITLHAALFFHWQFNGKQWLYFPLMVLTGAAATALHAAAWFIIGLELLWLFVRPRMRPLDGVLWALSTVLASLLPAWWYLNKTRWVTDAVEKSRFTGLEWIRDYTDLTWQTVAGLPIVHMFGFLWPDYPPSDRLKNWFSLGNDFSAHLATRSWPWLARAELWIAIGFLALLAVGLVPWRKIIARLRGKKYPPAMGPSTPIHFAFVVFTWVSIPMLLMALTWLQADSPWYRYVWGEHRTNPIWEPRYLGVLIPAWTLWVVAAIRRLPFILVRYAVAAAVILIATAFALTNHLMYRQHPWQQTAEIALKVKTDLPATTQPADRVMVLIPFMRYAGEAPLYNFYSVFGLRLDEPPAAPSWQKLELSPRTIRDDDYIRTIDRARANRRLRAIVITDRLGDLNDGDMTDEQIQNRLGPEWKLVDENICRLNYEWRYYIFHEWRTRAWVRPLPPPATAPVRRPPTTTTRPATRPVATASRPAVTQPASRPAATQP